MLEFLQIYDTDKSTDKSRDAEQVSSHWYWSERRGVTDFLSAIGDAATEVSRSPSKDASSLEKLSKVNRWRSHQNYADPVARHISIL